MMKKFAEVKKGENFMNKNNKICNKDSHCRNSACGGPCPAICEYIRREKEGL